MPKLRHPVSGAVYDACDDGLVRVETPDGAVGFFRGDGSHHHGELREADPQVCGWVGNDKSRRRFEPAKSDWAAEFAVVVCV